MSPTDTGTAVTVSSTATTTPSPVTSGTALPETLERSWRLNASLWGVATHLRLDGSMVLTQRMITNWCRGMSVCICKIIAASSRTPSIYGTVAGTTSIS